MDKYSDKINYIDLDFSSWIAFNKDFNFSPV